VDLRWTNLILPWLDDLKAAAKELDIPESQLIYEIRIYATRNSFFHSVLSHHTDDCRWQELAANIFRDLKILNDHYRNHPEEQLHMRRCIEELQNEWFDYIKDLNGKIVSRHPIRSRPNKGR